MRDNDEDGPGAMEISLIICTRNRARYLPPFLKAIEALEYPGQWEIIIVDNGSTDETGQVLAQYAAISFHHVRLIHEPVPGSGNAKNAGLRWAQGDIVAFTDDDCYPQADYLRQVKDAFADNTLGFMGGRVLLHDPLDLPITIKLDNTQKYYPATMLVGPGAIHGANFAFRRRALNAVDGFDALMGAGTRFPCEDCDALTRVSFGGWSGVYWPQAVVEHHHRRRSTEDLAKIRESYLAGRGAFYFKTLLFSTYRIRTLIGLLKSIRCFGLRAFLSECVFGCRYLVTRVNRA